MICNCGIAHASVHTWSSHNQWILLARISSKCIWLVKWLPTVIVTASKSSFPSPNGLASQTRATSDYYSQCKFISCCNRALLLLAGTFHESLWKVFPWNGFRLGQQVCYKILALQIWCLAVPEFWGGLSGHPSSIMNDYCTSLSNHTMTPQWCHSLFPFTIAILYLPLGQPFWNWLYIRMAICIVLGYLVYTVVNISSNNRWPHCMEEDDSEYTLYSWASYIYVYTGSFNGN